jgi:hypothetical protein
MYIAALNVGRPGERMKDELKNMKNRARSGLTLALILMSPKATPALPSQNRRRFQSSNDFLRL